MKAQTIVHLSVPSRRFTGVYLPRCDRTWSYTSGARDVDWTLMRRNV